MKTIILTISLAVTSIFMQAQSEQLSEKNGTTITITVPTQSNEGNIVLGLYTEDVFMVAAPTMSASAPVKDGKSVAVFENVPAGTYAILLFQDKNGNNQMDFEPNGMPTEPYGASNNVMSMGPPSWSDSSFELKDQPLEMEIRM